MVNLFVLKRNILMIKQPELVHLSNVQCLKVNNVVKMLKMT